MKTRYRIVRDQYCGYEVQKRTWYWPFWISCGFCNTHCTVEGAEQWLRGYMNEVVKEIS